MAGGADQNLNVLRWEGVVGGGTFNRGCPPPKKLNMPVSQMGKMIVFFVNAPESVTDRSPRHAANSLSLIPFNLSTSLSRYRSLSILLFISLYLSFPFISQSLSLPLRPYLTLSLSLICSPFRPFSHSLPLFLALNLWLTLIKRKPPAICPHLGGS